VAPIELARAAVEDIDRLISVLSLPDDTRNRIRRSLDPLAGYPLLGAELSGRWKGFRFVLGPWRWMVFVYLYEDATDRDRRNRSGCPVISRRDRRARSPVRIS
jgi:hypothetical protein